MKLTKYWRQMTGMEQRRHIATETAQIRRHIPSSWFTPVERKRHEEQAKKNLGVDKL
jgi:hypothetical protein